MGADGDDGEHASGKKKKKKKKNKKGRKLILTKALCHSIIIHYFIILSPHISAWSL